LDKQGKHSTGRLIWNALATYGLSWFWVTVVLSLLHALSLSSVLSSKIPHLSVSVSLLKYFPEVADVVMASPGLTLFMVLVFAPVIEEAIFRLLPLTIVQLVRKPQLTRAVLIVVCGIAFGLAHGHPLNVFIQGFAGLMLGHLYLKNARSQLSSYLSCVAVHAMYNLTVIMVALMSVPAGGS